MLFISWILAGGAVGMALICLAAAAHHDLRDRSRRDLRSAPLPLQKSPASGRREGHQGIEPLVGLRVPDIVVRWQPPAPRPATDLPGSEDRPHRRAA